MKDSSSTDSLDSKKIKKASNSKSKKNQLDLPTKKNNSKDNNQGEVLLKLPGGFKYKTPGKKQRIIVASLVIALNLVFLILALLYLYNPAFKEFIYNVGR